MCGAESQIPNYKKSRNPEDCGGGSILDEIEVGSSNLLGRESTTPRDGLTTSFFDS